MNLFKKIGIAVVGMAMAIGVGVGIASNKDVIPVRATGETWASTNDTFELATSIASGDKIIIVSTYATNAMGAQATNNRGVGAVTKAGNSVLNKTATPKAADSVALITVGTHNVSDTDYFTFAVDGGYLYDASTSSKNYLKTQNDVTDNGYADWTVSIDANGVASITARAASAASKLTMSYNTGNSLFACYSSLQTNGGLEIYKKTAAAQTYTVHFNGNGAKSGSMADVNDATSPYTLPSSSFVAPDNKSFAGWKKNNEGNLIAAGGTCAINGETTFYAQWADQRTMTYSPISSSGTGTGTMTDPNSPYGDGATVTVLANAFTAPQDMRFKEWRTNADGTGTKYDAGDTFTINANTTLYAIWEDIPPEITIYNTDVDNGDGLGNSYGEKDWSSNGCEGKVFGLKCTNATYNTSPRNSMQFKKDETGEGKIRGSYLYNTKATSGYITNISLTKGGSSAITGITIWASTSPITELPAEGGTANNSTWSWDFSSESHYTYFYIFNSSSSPAYIDYVTITYQKVAKVDPTGISIDDSSAITMDTYGYGKRTIKATVEPFNNNDDTVTWGSNNDSVVTIADGVLTPTGVGSTTVYCHTANYDSENPVAALIKTISVTVTQATYKKAKFLLTRSNDTTVLSERDDCLGGGSSSFETNGSWNSDHKGIGLSSGNTLSFTITGYKGMKITGVDLEVSSKGAGGGASLDVTIGSTNVLSIAAAKFSDATWNGAYEANTCNLYRVTTAHVVDTDEDIVFSFTGSENSFYVTSVAVRYLDYSLEQWCENFLAQITCTGATQQNPDGAITSDTNWGTLGTAFAGLDPDLREIAQKASADKDSESVIEQAMARYDLILRKYGIGTGAGQHTDFIGRFSVGGANYSAAANFGVDVTDNNSASTFLIIILSVVGVVTIGGYFLLRRRKED